MFPVISDEIVEIFWFVRRINVPHRAMKRGAKSFVTAIAGNRWPIQWWNNLWRGGEVNNTKGEGYVAETPNTKAVYIRTKHIYARGFNSSEPWPALRESWRRCRTAAQTGGCTQSIQRKERWLRITQFRTFRLCEHFFLGSEHFVYGHRAFICFRLKLTTSI